MSFSKLVTKIVPPLTSSLHKGQLGKIGIIGGCLEYTGAPYFAGISAQRVGADLVTIICSKEAGIPIKCYSPELIVYPVIQLSNGTENTTSLQSIIDENTENIKKILMRIDSLVIGPGAGRDPVMIGTLSNIIPYVIQRDIPLVLDGDGLWVVTENPSLLKGSKKVILTPNQMEFTRLWNCVMKESKNPAELMNLTHIIELSTKLDGITILQKGEKDQIANGCDYGCVLEESSRRRCGGQGDVVAGVMGVMNLWASRCEKMEVAPCYAAALCTSTIVRRASKRAFDEKKRAMAALDVIAKLPEVIDALFVCLKKHMIKTRFHSG